jgi:hypothetical protein
VGVREEALNPGGLDGVGDSSGLRSIVGERRLRASAPVPGGKEKLLLGARRGWQHRNRRRG